MRWMRLVQIKADVRINIEGILKVCVLGFTNIKVKQDFKESIFIVHIFFVYIFYRCTLTKNVSQ